MPTPLGVPVKITSPGSSGVTADSCSISSPTPKMRLEVRLFCICSPLTEQLSSRSSGLSNSSGVTSHGPTGPKPGNDLPMLNCGGLEAIWVIRSEMSCPIDRPATCGQASAAATRCAVTPMTTASSTSQSVWPAGGSSICPYGPVRHDGNLVNTGGAVSGRAKPDSAAWSL